MHPGHLENNAFCHSWSSHKTETGYWTFVHNTVRIYFIHTLQDIKYAFMFISCAIWIVACGLPQDINTELDQLTDNKIIYSKELLHFPPYHKAALHFVTHCGIADCNIIASYLHKNLINQTSSHGILLVFFSLSLSVSIPTWFQCNFDVAFSGMIWA